MQKYVILICILLFTSCKKDDNNSNGNNQGHTDDIIDLINCIDVTYPSWLNSPYVLPYPTSTSYLVRLSNCSGAHAEDTPDQFAYDFQMSSGTLVTAARAGTVVLSVDNGVDGGTVDNLVVVRHSDNTYAHYAHLKEQGALVTIGDTVQQGDDIGLSGSSGGVSYPHLHFVVTQNGFVSPYTSIPSTFFNTVSHPQGLEEGTFYIAEAY